MATKVFVSGFIHTFSWPTGNQLQVDHESPQSTIAPCMLYSASTRLITPVAHYWREVRRTDRPTDRQTRAHTIFLLVSRTDVRVALPKGWKVTSFVGIQQINDRGADVYTKRTHASWIHWPLHRLPCRSCVIGLRAFIVYTGGYGAIAHNGWHLIAWSWIKRRQTSCGARHVSDSTSSARTTWDSLDLPYGHHRRSAISASCWTTVLTRLDLTSAS